MIYAQFEQANKFSDTIFTEKTELFFFSSNIPFRIKHLIYSSFFRWIHSVTVAIGRNFTGCFTIGRSCEWKQSSCKYLEMHGI